MNPELRRVGKTEPGAEVVEAVPDRVVTYHSSFHSGVVPLGMSLSADPGESSLTACFFFAAVKGS